MAGTAAVIVTYNSADAIEGCITALRRHAPGTQVIVVDNASTDETLQIVQRSSVQVIANAQNLGFAAACNLGAAATDAGFLLLLNPDAHLRSPLDAITEACREYGVAGGRLEEEDGRPQAGWMLHRFPTPGVLALGLLGMNRLWPSNPWNRKYCYLDRDLATPGPAEQPAGAFLMVRRDVWDRLGGMDPEFHPIWFEDVDLCLRAAQAGYPAYYQPESVARHFGGHSIKKIDEPSRLFYWYASLLRYAGKHFGSGDYRLLCMAGALGACLRMFEGIVREKSLKPIGNYRRILNFVGRRLVSGPPFGYAQRPGSEY